MSHQIAVPLLTAFTDVEAGALAGAEAEALKA